MPISPVPEETTMNSTSGYTCVRRQTKDKQGEALGPLGCPDECGHPPGPMCTLQDTHFFSQAEGGVRSIFSFKHSCVSLNQHPDAPGALALVSPTHWRAAACRETAARCAVLLETPGPQLPSLEQATSTHKNNRL